MLERLASEFLTPTKKMRRLNILLTICDDSATSQHKIGTSTNLSSSMVNNYLREFQDNGLITVTGDTNRNQRYHLTRKGREELKNFLDLYSAEISEISENAQNELDKIKELSNSLLSA